MNVLFNVLWEMMGLALLSIPLIWELWNDKNGDAHISRAGWNSDIQMLSKKVDVFARCVFAGTAAVINYVLGINTLIASVIMSGAIHFLLFDYIIVYILVKNGVISPSARWWNYLGSKGMDNSIWWKELGWEGRLVTKVLVFIIACMFYWRQTIFDLI